MALCQLIPIFFELAGGQAAFLPCSHWNLSFWIARGASTPAHTGIYLFGKRFTNGGIFDRIEQ